MSEFAKKELLTLCFSCCQGLWMFLDKSSFTRVHMLLQRLGNLLTLAQWARRQLSSAHLWHGVGIPCVMCRDTCGSSEVRHGCWKRAHSALRQHILLGQLVQWWGIMGLLPKYPEAHEVKRIAQMWKEMDHSHRKTCLETSGWEEVGVERWKSFIEGMVTELEKQHGCIWTSEDCTDQVYPPSNLQALLKLVLVPHIDHMSVQAILMYFTLDMANFLQCKDDLLQSFCHAFTIPSSFSQQIRALWMLDHGHIKASMELLLSPRATVPWLSWQHRCVIHCLLARKQPRLALRYLHWTMPAMESVEDAKLCADVLLQNSCVSDAWALLKKSHTESDDMVMYFLQACEGFGLCAEALKYIPVGYKGEGDNGGIETAGSPLLKIQKDCSAGSPPCPLSAKLYQAQKVNSVSPEELVKLVREGVMEVRELHPKISEVVWPEHTVRKSNSREMFLSTQALCCLTPNPSPMDMAGEAEHTAQADKPEEQPETPEHVSSSESPLVEDLSSESVSSFTSASSLPLLRQEHPYVYQSSLTLQRISSLLTDGENESREEEEEEVESTTSSSVGVLLDCSELAVTLDGTTDSISLSNLNKDILVELMLSGEGGDEDFKTCVFPRENRVTTFMDEVLLLNERMNLPSQFNSDDDNQLVPYFSESQVDSHSFPSPEYENMACCKSMSEENVKVLSNISTSWSSAVSLNRDDQSDSIPPQIFSFSGAATSDCFLEEEPHQDLLSDLRQSLQLEENAACGSGASARMGEPGSSLLTPVCSSTQLLILGKLCTSSTSCNTQTSSAPCDTNQESFLKAHLKTVEACDQSTSYHCKMGSWWKQDLETHRASFRLLASTEPGAAIKSDKRPSLILNQPYSYSLVTSKQKADSRDGTQADKVELADWTVSQGAIRSGRRKGKRVKRT
ncbi:uncharacterized protein LOC134001318 [Scomber scombrus]|uniref:uncharacterized protein LOC134001318 n=1 Tax=Scomber scombrus TaxID=13677 RepID=UPI002DDA36B4|nr:uncharacterized protein LOC134001318 [Scomber scombrus]